MPDHFHFLLECCMKGHLHLRMEELLQSVDILGLKVMISMALRQCFLEEIFEVIFHMEKKIS